MCVLSIRTNMPNSDGKNLLFPIFPCFHSLIFLHCDDDEYNSLCLHSIDSTMICSIRCVHYAIHTKRLLLLVSFSIYAIRGYYLNKWNQSKDLGWQHTLRRALIRQCVKIFDLLELVPIHLCSFSLKSNTFVWNSTQLTAAGWSVRFIQRVFWCF